MEEKIKREVERKRKENTNKVEEKKKGNLELKRKKNDVFDVLSEGKDKKKS